MLTHLEVGNYSFYKLWTKAERYHCLSKVNLGGCWQSRGQQLGLPAVDTAASLCKADGGSSLCWHFVHSCTGHRTEMPHCMGSASTSTVLAGHPVSGRRAPYIWPKWDLFTFSILGIITESNVILSKWHVSDRLHDVYVTKLYSHFGR